MHVMTKYLDTRKAAIAALQDFHLMEQILESTDQQVKDAYDDLASPVGPRRDGTPSSGDLHAGERRIAATLDRIDVYRGRYLQAQEYMGWFLPAWEFLSEDDRFVLEAFFLAEGSQEDAVSQVCERFYVERDSAYRKKNRALARLSRALYG